MASATMQQAARSTPVRAIPSNLAVKTSPSIPPPTQTYEPLVKAVLRHRLVYNIFLQSALLTWGIVILSIWQSSSTSIGMGGLALLPFRPFTLIVSSFVWLSIALPMIVLRKAMLTSTRTPATSPAGSLAAAMSKPSMRHAIVVYATSALLMAAIHASVAYAVEPTDPKLRLFVKSKKHPHYLNGRILFLTFSQITIAVSYAVRNIMLDRFVFKWNLASQKDDQSTRLNITDFIRAAVISTLLSTLAAPVAGAAFTLGRFFLPVLYRLPVISSFLRPFTAHFLRGPLTVLLPLRHADLIRRAWYMGFTTFFIWETSDTLFELNIAKQTAVSHLTADPNQTLVSGISSTDATFKYLAYSELHTLSGDKSAAATAQRISLFSDQKQSPPLWTRLVRESLVLLGRDYQHLLRRGKPEPPTTAPPPPKPTSPDHPVSSSPVPLLRRRIFKSDANADNALDAALETLASDGPINKVVDAGINVVELPEIFRSTETKPIPTSAKEAEKGAGNTKGPVETAKQRIRDAVNGAMAKYAPPVVKEQFESWLGWWRNERINKVVERCLPFRELDVVVIEVISLLTCASLTEDRYGVVQRDIPRILEAFLSFLSAVEEYQISVNSLHVAPKVDEQLSPKELQERERVRYEVERAGEVLSTIADGLKEGVARIVRTFGDKLLAFKFPPRTAQKLQGFLDYC